MLVPSLKIKNKSKKIKRFKSQDKNSNLLSPKALILLTDKVNVRMTST